MTVTPHTAKTSIDVRVIPPYERHSTIFSALEALEPGHALQIVNDHDPRPLRQQMEMRYPEQFGWTYMETGPVWRVDIIKLSTHKCTCGNH